MTSQNVRCATFKTTIETNFLLKTEPDTNHSLQSDYEYRSNSHCSKTMRFLQLTQYICVTRHLQIVFYKLYFSEKKTLIVCVTL